MSVMASNPTGATPANHVTPAKAGVWGLDNILSGIGINRDISGDILLNVVRKRRFVDILSNEGDQVKERRPFCVFSPFWQLIVIVGSSGSEGFKSGQKKHAVNGHGKGRLPWDRGLGVDLSLADAEEAFFIAMVDFDLPSVEIGLNERFGLALGIRAQKV